MAQLVKNILKQCDELSHSDIDKLMVELTDLYWKKYNAKYKRVYVYPGDIIAHKITTETGFNCYHKPCTYSMGRGTHVIEIPIEQYNENLERKLKDDYDY